MRKLSRLLDKVVDWHLGDGTDLVVYVLLGVVVLYFVGHIVAMFV